MRYLSSLFLFFLLVSCRSLEHSSTVVQNGSELFNVVRSADTVVVRDSVFVSERQKGDTVYLTRTEYSDRWRTQIVHDTIVRSDSIVQVIEHPPERYIPKFYKHSTAIFWILMALLILPHHQIPFLVISVIFIHFFCNITLFVSKKLCIW